MQRKQSRNIYTIPLSKFITITSTKRFGIRRNAEDLSFILRNSILINFVITRMYNFLSFKSHIHRIKNRFKWLFQDCKIKVKIDEIKLN